MHLLKKLDRIIKRKVLSERTDIHYVYLSTLVSKGHLSEEVRVKLLTEAKGIIRELQRITKEEE